MTIVKVFCIIIATLILLTGYGCESRPSSEAQPPPRVTVLPSAVEGPAQLPYLTSDLDNLFMSWVETMGDSALFKYARWNGLNWGNSYEIAKGRNLLVNWADYPMIAADNSGNLIGHFLTKSSSGPYSYDVNITGSAGGIDWMNSFIPHSDGTETEHGFVTMVPESPGKFQLAWLDGRNTSIKDPHRGAMTLRAAVTDLQGNLEQDLELDPRVCDCCQTTAVLTDEGPVVFYRDRSDQEIRDIAVVRKVNGSWSKPQIVHADNWEINGCPVNGPRSSFRNGHLAVAWYTGAGNQPRIKVIFSKDAGRHFGPVIVLEDPNPLGRVDVVSLGDGKAVVSWLSKNEEDAVIMAQVVHSSGELQAPVAIATSSQVRASGFPQMAWYQNALYLAWTQVSDEDTSYIKFAKVELSF